MPNRTTFLTDKDIEELKTDVKILRDILQRQQVKLHPTFNEGEMHKLANLIQSLELEIHLKERTPEQCS
jgi:hypothetical protein